PGPWGTARWPRSAAAAASRPGSAPARSSPSARALRAAWPTPAGPARRSPAAAHRCDRAPGQTVHVDEAEHHPRLTPFLGGPGGSELLDCIALGSAGGRRFRVQHDVDAGDGAAGNGALQRGPDLRRMDDVLAVAAQRL